MDKYLLHPIPALSKIRPDGVTFNKSKTMDISSVTLSGVTRLIKISSGFCLCFDPSYLFNVQLLHQISCILTQLVSPRTTKKQ